METPKNEVEWQAWARALAGSIQQFVTVYAASESRQPISDGYTRGYYTALFAMLEAAPPLWGLLNRDTQAILNKAKHLIDDHYHQTDALWPPKSGATIKVVTQG